MGKQYNPMTGKIENSNHRSNGKKFSGYSPEEGSLIVQDKSIISPDGTRLSDDYEKSRLEADRTIKQLKEHNNKVVSEVGLMDNYLLSGKQVIVRLFKHIPYDYKLNSFLYNPLVIPY